MEPTVGKQVGQILSPGDTGEGHVQDGRREKQDRLGEDDRHHACVVDLERHVLSLASVNLTANNPLSVLDADFSLCLRDRNYRSYHKNQECNH